MGATLKAGARAAHLVCDLSTVALPKFCLTISQLMASFAAVGELAAMSIQSIVKLGEFEPDAIAAMSEAFEAACKELNDDGQAKLVLEVIAERIVGAASIGERDPVRLRKAALAGLPDEDAFRGLAPFTPSGARIGCPKV